MGKKSSAKKVQEPKGPRKFSKGDGKVNRIERYEDTLEEGGVDDFMFKRDKISFNDADEASDDEDLLTGDTEGVFDLDLEAPSRSKKSRHAEEEDDYDEDEDEDTPLPSKKDRKGPKPLPTKKGRYAKSESDSDASGSDSGTGSDDPDAEGWGRSYHSRPSTRRGREEDEEDDEEREEERAMEEKEVRRLQRKGREAIKGDGDWGLEGLGEVFVDETQAAPTSSKSIATPTSLPIPTSLPSSTNPTTLLRHLQTNDPVKLALAREFPLIVKRLEKVERGIRFMESKGKERATEEGGEGSQLHHGLGWLHYQILLTYSTTLAFYLHLASLPLATRPDFSTHPVLPRLLQLKQGLAMLEDLDFAAASDDEGDTIELYDGMEDSSDEGELDEEEAEKRKRELVGLLGADGVDWDDAEDTWEGGELEEDELEELRRDAEEDIREARREKAARKKAAAKKAGAVEIDEEMEEDSDDEADVEEEGEEDSEEDETEEGDDEDMIFSDDDLDMDDRSLSPSPPPVPVVKKGKGRGKVAIKATNVPSYTVLAEPEFVPSTRKSSKPSTSTFEDDRGDPTHLSSADAADKSAKTRSLRFHTSKIAATSARRSAARQDRMGGDDDVPYRDKKAGRDDALRKSGPKGDAGEDLDGQEWTEKDRKRAREVMEMEDGPEEADQGEDGYYELVKRQKREERMEKKDEHDMMVAAEKEAIMSAQDGAAGGPRGLTRSIEKNRGLTPHRKKSVRNPRVKKREAYEKAKQKVGSMRAVYKGGQGALGGNYEGEKTGISTTVKSRRF